MDWRARTRRFDVLFGTGLACTVLYASGCTTQGDGVDESTSAGGSEQSTTGDETDTRVDTSDEDEATSSDTLPSGDGDGDGDGDGGGDLGTEVSIVSYNLYGWNALVQNPWKGENMMALLNAYLPDFVSAQEFEGQSQWVRDELQGNYALAGDELHGVAILYDDDVWELLATDIVYLAEMDQWGQRIARWGYFEHEVSTRRLYIFDTHWCVCSGPQLLGSATTVVEAIVNRSDLAAPVLLNGDLNVFEGFEDSLAVQYLKGGMASPLTMVDTFRVVHPEAWGSTFGDAGKIDYVLATTDVEVLDAFIDRETIAPGEVSDHDPVLATIRIQ